jgi:hypothetical protein
MLIRVFVDPLRGIMVQFNIQILQYHNRYAVGMIIFIRHFYNTITAMRYLIFHDAIFYNT